jgi:hypothetical protein
MSLPGAQLSVERGDLQTYFVPAGAQGGQLDVLKWAREHLCPWDETTCEAAAAGRDTELLQWARMHDCPWDARTK